MFKSYIFLLFFAASVFSVGLEPLNILNFRAVNGANALVKQNDTIFIATGGGLAQFRYSDGNFLALHHSHEQFPEISLTALEVDDGGLWIGSENGYLYYRQRNRRQRIFNDLFMQRSRINQIRSFGDYLVIAHEKGISVFDKKRGAVVSTRRNFTGLANTNATLIATNGTSIYFAVKSGNQSAIVSLNDFQKYLGDPRLNDNSPFAAQIPWEIEPVPYTEIKTLYFDKDGNVLSSDKFMLFNEDYKIESDGNTLYKIYNSEKETQEFDFSVIPPSESNINFVKLIDGKVTVGTKYDFAYFVFLDGGLNFRHFEFPGLINDRTVSKLFLDSDNSLWVLPSIDGNKRWHCSDIFVRIMRNGAINRVSQSDIDGFGFTNCDGAAIFTGVAESGSSMFFGLGGNPLRQYDKITNSWGRWFFNFENSTAELITDGAYRRSNWSKIDNILEINGLIYGTLWRRDRPVLFELNPLNSELRFFLNNQRPDLGHPNGLIKTTGGVLVSFSLNNKLWYLNEKNYDVIADTIILSDNPTALHRTGGGNVIVGTTGMPVILSGGTSSKNVLQIKKLPPEKFAIEAQDIVLEYSEELWSGRENQRQIRNVFWIANNTVGVERVVIDEYISLNGTLDSAVYDTAQTIFALTTANGGINSEVTALAIDGAQNLLWIGGNNGITRLRLPQRNALSSVGIDYVFPNPFVLSRHTTLSIPTPQNSFVDIYTVSGKLVKSMNEKSPEFTKTIDGTYIYRWRIPQNLAAGTYIVVVKSLGTSGRTDRKNTQQYKLVVIR